MNTTTIAKKYLAHGFSPIPLIDGEKRPSIRNWQQYGEEPMGLQEAERLFQNTGSIGLVMGFDGIQCLDIDAKHFRGKEYEVFCERLEEESPGLKDKMIIQTTRSGGFHWIFKCDEIAGNQKFARNIDGEVTFETRGRGGQIVTYPSKGYKILGKITNVKRISPVERDVIFRVARTMDEMQKEVVVESKRIGDIETQDQTPWGEFRATHTALDILQRYGWSIVGESSKYIYLLRPGSTDSKTSGVIFKDTELFWPWTTSSAFEAEMPYDGFQCYTLLEHGGSFDDAIKDIREQGYGKRYELSAPNDFNIDLDDEEVQEEMGQLLAKLRVDSTIEVSQPPKALEMVFGQNSYIIGSFGNFSLVQGKAKSRKSFFLSALAAAASSDSMVCEHLRGYIYPRKVIYIDTEQGDFHAAKAKKRVHEMAGLQGNLNYDHIEYIKLRSLDTNALRLAAIDYIFRTEENIGYMVIDGIADVASKGVNDEEEATAIASKLLKWTAEYNCHITVVLHENKNDRNAKGHLGQYIVQKSESTFSAKKSEHNRDITEITPEYTRNIEPPAIEMSIGGFDLVEFSEVEVDEFYNKTRVWTDEDKHRIAAKILGKSKGDAATFIRDTEDCKRKDAEKVLALMEENSIIHWDGKRPKIVALGPKDGEEPIDL
jgi:hypothetical protein